MFSSILKVQREASLNVTTQSSAASTLLCTCGVYRLKFLEDNRQCPVTEWIVQIRCRTDQTHFAEYVGSNAFCFFAEMDCS